MNKPITMMMDQQKVEDLKEIARRRSLDQHRDVCYTDLIREAIDATFFGSVRDDRK